MMDYIRFRSHLARAKQEGYTPLTEKQWISLVQRILQAG